MIARLLLVTAAAFVFCAPIARAQSDGWVYNPSTKCRAWNSSLSEPNRTFTWSGDCQTNVAQGVGVMLWFTNGIPSGRYTGEYRGGRMNGRGVFEYANGDVYEGEFRDDKPNGRGILRSVSGNRYAGLVRDGAPVLGEMTVSHGTSGKRTFRDGQVVRGEVKYEDGGTYSGDLRHEMPNGWGVLTAPDGRYEGEFASGKPNGFGTYTANGTAFAGLWINGCFQQRGRTANVLVSATDCGFAASKLPP
jgi:hypothetical protein